MKLPLNSLKHAMLRCALLALAAMMLGCLNSPEDRAWKAKRAAELVGKKNPETGKPYTPEEASDQAATELKDIHMTALGPMGTAMTAVDASETAREVGEAAERSAMRNSMLMGSLSRNIQTPPAPLPVVTPHVEVTPVNCFVAGTLVHTASGARKIQDIRTGDTVLSFNARNGKVEHARVGKVITGRRADLMVLTSQSGEITCTQDHPFFTSDRRPTVAAAFSISDKVMALGAGSAVVVPMKLAVRHQDLNAPVPVYNFEVEGTRAYFVGPDAILCHQ